MANSARCRRLQDSDFYKVYIYIYILGCLLPDVSLVCCTHVSGFGFRCLMEDAPLCTLQPLTDAGRGNEDAGVASCEFAGKHRDAWGKDMEKAEACVTCCVTPSPFGPFPTLFPALGCRNFDGFCLIFLIVLVLAAPAPRVCFHNSISFSLVQRRA